jgi:hypothetical protein
MIGDFARGLPTVQLNGGGGYWTYNNECDQQETGSCREGDTSDPSQVYNEHCPDGWEYTAICFRGEHSGRFTCCSASGGGDGNGDNGDEGWDNGGDGTGGSALLPLLLLGGVLLFLVVR